MYSSDLFEPAGKIIEGHSAHVGDRTDAIQKFRFKALDFSMSFTAHTSLAPLLNSK